MPRPRKLASPFRYFTTSPEVIRLAVLMYLRCALSLRIVGGRRHGGVADACCLRAPVREPSSPKWRLFRTGLTAPPAPLSQTIEMSLVPSKTPQFCGLLHVHPPGRRDAAGRSGHLLGGRQRRRESASLNLARLSRACLLFDCTAGAVGGEPVGRLSGGSSRQAICLSAALTDRGMSENPLFAETVNPRER